MIKAVIFDMYETLVSLYESWLYFGTQMAEDAGVSEEAFQKLWKKTEDDRTLGKLTLEETLEYILKELGCYDPKLHETMVYKRKESRVECFRHLHPEILPMLEGLKERGVKVALISNCFSEEAEVIHQCPLYPFFDVPLLSYEQGLKKPDPELYQRCLDELELNAQECLYVGDGGSSELEAAQELGMHTAQAVWYLKEGTKQPCGRKEGFVQIERPLDLLTHL